MIDGKPEYKIFQIINSKIDYKYTCKLLYKVIWLKYKNTKKESDWLPTSKLAYTTELISEFY